MRPPCLIIGRRSCSISLWHISSSSLPPCLFKMHTSGYQSHVSIGLRKIPQSLASLWVNLFRVKSKMITSLRQLVQQSLCLPKLSQSRQTVDHPEAADCESALLS